MHDIFIQIINILNYKTSQNKSQRWNYRQKIYQDAIDIKHKHNNKNSTYKELRIVILAKPQANK